jgi:glutamate racemase
MNNIKGIKEFYDDTVEIWADDWYENLTMLPFLVKVKETLPKGKKIYIISTQATKDSNFYQDALCDYEVDAHATPEFVLMVEHNEITKEKVAKVILDKPFDSDGIILGCTHFNYLHDICKELLGEKVCIFDGLENLEGYIKNY